MDKKTKQELLRGISRMPETASYYAKRSCRHCYGRGLLTMDVTNGPGIFARGTILCQCISKRLDKDNG